MDDHNMINADQINAAYYENAINDLCARYLTEFYPNTDNYTNNHLLAVMPYIYDTLFKPDKNLPNNQKCNIPYNEYNLNVLFNIYLRLYNRYLCLPSLYSFSRLTGITEECLQAYVTTARLAIVNNRKDLIQGKLYNTPLGLTVLANNDQDSGMMYNRQNIIDNQTIKQGLTLNDFVKISDKSHK